MDLPVQPPVAPMLAKSVADIPDVGHIEPKWDGFRTIVFRDGDEVLLGSRNEKPMTRYFPEVVAAILDNTPDRCVLDGEIVVALGDRLEFDALQQRIHPAASRVKLLSEQTPASFVAFDLLALGNESLMKQPFSYRRENLVQALANAKPPIYVTPATTDITEGRQWFEAFEGAGLDGVVAKPLDGPYQSDKRVMYKVKHLRTADCVVAGFRWHTSGKVIGSLLLGLYGADGQLHHVGVVGAFPMKQRQALVAELESLRIDTDSPEAAAHPWALWAQQSEHENRRMPGAVSRWNATKNLSFELLRPERVVEVSYGHLEGPRFRHTAQFRRWRTDRDPQSCRYDQLEDPPGCTLSSIWQRTAGQLSNITGQPLPRNK